MQNEDDLSSFVEEPRIVTLPQERLLPQEQSFSQELFEWEWVFGEIEVEKYTVAVTTYWTFNILI